MLKTNNFLGCFKLETGGLVIGWIIFISSIVGVFMCAASAIGLSFFSCGDIGKLIQQHSDTDMTKFDEEGCNIARTVLIVVLIILVFIEIGFAIIGFLCIKGVEHRDHIRVRPMMIVAAVLAIFSLLGILSFTAYGIFSAIFYGILYGYIFVVLYSLYDNFKREYLGGSTAQYQMPIGKA